MKFNELDVKKNKQSNRVGRGIAAGGGKTAGRGTKGQKSRTGSSKKPGFEGGQNPLLQRLPKLPGFKSHRIKPSTIYTNEIDLPKSKLINNEVLVEAKLIESIYTNVKLIVKGELKTAHDVKLYSASKSAIEQVKKSGGTFEKTLRLRSEKIK